MTLTITVIKGREDLQSWPEGSVVLPNLTQVQVNRIIMIWNEWLDKFYLNHVRIAVTD